MCHPRYISPHVRFFNYLNHSNESLVWGMNISVEVNPRVSVNYVRQDMTFTRFTISIGRVDLLDHFECFVMNCNLTQGRQ